MSKTNTAQEADIRLHQLRIGSLAGYPTMEYLVSLRDGLRQFLLLVDNEIVECVGREKGRIE